MKIVKAIDTSGSVNAGDAWPQLLRGIDVGDHVIMFDSRIYDCGVMRSDEQIRTLEAKGGGASDLAVIVDWCLAQRDPIHVVIMTDGFVPMPRQMSQFLRGNRHRMRFTVRYYPYYMDNPLERELPRIKEFMRIVDTSEPSWPA